MFDTMIYMALIFITPKPVYAQGCDIALDFSGIFILCTIQCIVLMVNSGRTGRRALYASIYIFSIIFSIILALLFFPYSYAYIPILVIPSTAWLLMLIACRKYSARANI